MIKAITFDLDGVYFLNGKENFIKNLSEKYGVGEDETRRVFLKSEEMNSLYKTGRWSDEQFWKWAISEWKIDGNWEKVVELLIEGYEVNEEVIGMINKLKNNNYRILACSNNFPARVDGLDKRFRFLSNFDTAVFSYETGVLKPEKGIFEELIKRSGCEANEIVYSDDSEDKLSGAKELGINAFVYENFGQFGEELKKLGIELQSC